MSRHYGWAQRVVTAHQQGRSDDLNSFALEKFPAFVAIPMLILGPLRVMLRLDPSH
jgi:hypothetical protein